MIKFIQKKPLITFFILTFTLSWAGIIFASFFMGMPTTSTQFIEKGPIVLIPLLLGPTVISLILTGAVYGKSGFQDLKSRIFKWKIAVRWYLFAI